MQGGRVGNGLPSQGEPPSSMAAADQGFVVVSGAGRAMAGSVRLALATTAAAAWLAPMIDVRVRPDRARPDLSPHLLHFFSCIIISQHVLA